jgi:nicotinate-nucleotide adenylyltransferase
VDTLEELHRRDPQAQLFLLIGSDCLPDLVHWRAPARIGELAELLIMARAGWFVEDLEELHRRLQLPPQLRLRQLVQAPLIDLASRDLRRRAAEGRSLRYLVPRSVEVYIRTHHLYQ